MADREARLRSANIAAAPISVALQRLVEPVPADLASSSSSSRSGLAARLRPMKTVGTKTCSEIEPEPSKAWQRGVALDAMLRAAQPVRPRGAWRLTHSQMNRLDLERQVEQAAKVNQCRE